jgi:thymidine kinase
LVEFYKINIVVTGLDGDSNRNKFGHILDLIPLCNSCTKINAACIMCLDGTPAPFSFRLVESSDKVLVGGSESYIPVCRKHFNELKNKDISSINLKLNYL